MNAKQHILSELKEVAQPVQMEDIGNAPIEEAIYAKVMSKKFRKLKVDNDCIKITKGAIKYAVEHKQPVKIGILFGGNKLWRFEEAPEIDWAELFSLIYFLHWMKSITSVYKYGAHLDYYSQDVSVETMNNVPSKETIKYSQTFREMLEWIKPYIPKGVKVTYRRHAEEYKNVSEYYKELEAGKKMILAKNKGKLPELSEEQKAATELNVKLRPGQAKDPLWREKVELEHQAIFETKTLVRYMTDPTIIPACPTIYPALIATGSTKRSYAKFWAAVGVLEKSDKGFNDLVITPKQLKTAKFKWEEVNLKGLKGKNFSKVRILE